MPCSPHSLSHSLSCSLSCSPCSLSCSPCPCLAHLAPPCPCPTEVVGTIKPSITYPHPLTLTEVLRTLKPSLNLTLAPYLTLLTTWHAPLACPLLNPLDCFPHLGSLSLPRHLCSPPLSLSSWLANLGLVPLTSKNTLNSDAM